METIERILGHEIPVLPEPFLPESVLRPLPSAPHRPGEIHHRLKGERYVSISAAARILLDAFSSVKETESSISPDTFDLLSDYCIGITAMDSIEKAMTGMTVQQKTRFISSITEMFLGDSYRLNQLIGGMMVYRYDILARENAAVASSNAAATLPKPPEETGATKQATTRQFGILFRYLLGELGIDFTNSDKSEWARLISFISGYDSETLRKKFDVDYDRKQTLKDMDIVCAAIRNLMPGLARKMEKDRKG